jgi:hypothetical protein
MSEGIDPAFAKRVAEEAELRLLGSPRVEPDRFVAEHAETLALQLRFSLQVSALCGGLVSSAPS